MTSELKKFYLDRSRMTEFLTGLEGADVSDAVSVYIPSGMTAAGIEELLGNFHSHSAPEEFIERAIASSNGAVIFWGSAGKYLVLPPFPLNDEKTIFNGYVAGPLRTLLNSDFKIGLVLAHLGSYAVGVCRSEKLISSKVGTGLVHGRHKKGGSSSGRFQRRRENQAREFLDRVCGHAREHLEPHKQELDYLVYGGPRQTVLQLKKRCPFLQSFEDRTLPLLDVPVLRQKVLETTVGRLWNSTIIEWEEDED